MEVRTTFDVIATATLTTTDRDNSQATSVKQQSSYQIDDNNKDQSSTQRSNKQAAMNTEFNVNKNDNNDNRCSTKPWW